MGSKRHDLCAQSKLEGDGVTGTVLLRLEASLGVGGTHSKDTPANQYNLS